MMIDADKILKALQTDPAQALREFGAMAAAAGVNVADRVKTDPAARNLALVGAGGVVAGLLAGSAAPRFAGAAARLGSLAALGGLAYQAWRRAGAARTGAPPPVGEIAPPPAGFLPVSGADDRERLAKLTLKAMINAVKADGQIESDEKVKLFDRLGQVSLTEAERDFLFEELARPMDTDGLVQAAETPALAAHIYAASLLAIDPDHPAERAYLDDLARRMGLEPSIVAEIQAAA